MSWKNDFENYGLVAKTLHWILACALIYMLYRGYFGLHKAIGLTILLLVVLRLIWRGVSIQPLLPSSMSRHQIWMAHAGHYALYALMLAIPVSGWLRSMLAGRDVSLFGIATIPTFFEKNMPLSKLFSTAHDWLTQALIVMIALHVLAALYHHFILKDNILRRIFWR